MLWLTSIGKLTLNWQFAVIMVLIGVLLIYVIVLANRVAFANATLKRIEEALLKVGSVTENAPAPAADVPVTEAVQTPEAPTVDRRVSYMTVRDLKVIAQTGRRKEDKAVAETLLTVDAINTSGEQHIAEPPETNIDTQTASDDGAAIEVASPETQPAMNTSEEPANSPATRDVDAEDMESKKREEALFIMNAQRRRRRARGY